MEKNQASATALVSSFGRAYHSLFDEEPKIFNDFLARDLITNDEFASISKHMAEGIQFFNPQEAHLYPDAESALKWVIQTQIAPTPLARSRYTEDMLKNALMLGVKQYVILGAGYDTFAFRNPDLLKQMTIFEVDHPDTQVDKRRRMAELGWEIPPSLKFVSVDFSEEQFKGSLLQAGFDPHVRTFFSWLGVTYYLTRKEIFNMFKDIANLAPKGSAIVFDYSDEGLFNENPSLRVKNMLGMAKMAGEPMKTAYSYEELEADLEKAGLLIYEHLSPVDIEERYFKGRRDYYHAFEHVHYVLAVVQ